MLLAQEKIAVKVRRKEITIQNLTIETERIRVKGANDELTAGQASTLARNERTMDLLKEEVPFSLAFRESSEISFRSPFE